MPSLNASILSLIALIGCASSASAAGGGAGAGGAGAQRAINSGLPIGEAGPLGSPNNPRRLAPAKPSAIKGSPRLEQGQQQTR